MFRVLIPEPATLNPGVGLWSTEQRSLHRADPSRDPGDYELDPQIRGQICNSEFVICGLNKLIRVSEYVIAELQGSAALKAT